MTDHAPSAAGEYARAHVTIEPGTSVGDQWEIRIDRETITTAKSYTEAIDRTEKLRSVLEAAFLAGAEWGEIYSKYDE